MDSNGSVVVANTSKQGQMPKFSSHMTIGVTVAVATDTTTTTTIAVLCWQTYSASCMCLNVWQLTNTTKLSSKFFVLFFLRLLLLLLLCSAYILFILIELSFVSIIYLLIFTQLIECVKECLESTTLLNRLASMDLKSRSSVWGICVCMCVLCQNWFQVGFSTFIHRIRVYAFVSRTIPFLALSAGWVCVDCYCLLVACERVYVCVWVSVCVLIRNERQ